jgi:ribonuclease P/MRP protein subunit POP5
LLKRVKRRYLALEIDSAEAFDSKEFMDAVWSVVTRLYGEYGASQTSLTMIEYDTERNFAVIRVANDAVDMVRATLASVTGISGKPVAIHVLRVSGTIRALWKDAKRRFS